VICPLADEPEPRGLFESRAHPDGIVALGVSTWAGATSSAWPRRQRRLHVTASRGGNSQSAAHV